MTVPTNSNWSSVAQSVSAGTKGGRPRILQHRHRAISRLQGAALALLLLFSRYSGIQAVGGNYRLLAGPAAELGTGRLSAHMGLRRSWGIACLWLSYEEMPGDKEGWQAALVL